jgi:peptidoglycan hydrolase-like protein with peptidoglycan-binding domain
MTKITTAACALALGFAWAAAPAIAQETPKKDAERKADQIEKQTEQKADKIESDARQKAAETRSKGDAEADRVRGKTDGGSDTAGGKMDRAWEKTKAKTRDMTDKAKDKMGAGDHATSDVRDAQRALKAKGFDPGPVDGKMGPRTSAAVKQFQGKENLTETGTLDAETQSRLMASSSPAASPATGPKETNPKRQSQ